MDFVHEELGTQQEAQQHTQQKWIFGRLFGVALCRCCVHSHLRVYKKQHPRNLLLSAETMEEHQPTLQSILEPVRAEIAELRAKHWPFRKIQTWLKEERGIAVFHTTIFDFCKVRKIKKGKGETATSTQERRTAPRHHSAPLPNIKPSSRETNTRIKLDSTDFDFGA